MDNSLSESNTILCGVVAAAACVGLLYMACGGKKNPTELPLWSSIRPKLIKVIRTSNECLEAVAILEKHCTKYKALGIDCEWNPGYSGYTAGPVALLQLASGEGFCALFRLCEMPSIPPRLSNLLRDPNILKVGIQPIRDAEKLYNDYSIIVNGTLDLNFLAVCLKNEPGGLETLSKSVLGEEMEKSPVITLSNWEGLLTETQINYAANDALVGLRIFMKLANEFGGCDNSNTYDLTALKQSFQPYIDVLFKRHLHTFHVIKKIT